MDEKIIQIAKSLIRAVNKSGRTVLKPELDDKYPDTIKGFGHLDIWIHGGREIVVEYIGDNGYRLRGDINNVK